MRQGIPGDVLRPSSQIKIEAASDELPSTIELGVGYTYSLEEQHKLTMSSVFQNNNFSDDEYKFGLEYNFDNTLFLRGGYDLAQETLEDSYIYGFTAGAGVHYTFTGLDVTVDYAFRSVDFLQDNHIFAVRLGF